MSDPTILIRQNPLDLSPNERLKKVREVLSKESREDWGKIIPKFLDPNARVVTGAVTIADREGAETVHYRHSTTAPGATDGTLRPHTVQAPRDLWEQMRRAPRRRAPLERVDSMVRRYVGEWKAGNGKMLENLGREICGEYWLHGMPLSEDKLRQLAAASLLEAENKRKAQFHTKSVKPWAVK